MANVYIYLDKRKALKNGEYPLKLAITQNQSTCYIKTNISINPENWNGFEIVGHYKKKQYNSVLKSFLTQAESTILDLKLSGKLARFTASQIKDLIEGLSYNREIKPVTLSEQLLKIISLKTGGTKEVYKTTYKKLQEYIKETGKDDTMQAINANWIKEFEFWCGKTNSVNTIGINLRNIRKAFNDAIDDELITNYPFRRFKIKKEQTRKRALTIHEFVLLRDLKLELHAARYRDYFILMFYLLGINMKDLMGLKEIEKGRVYYRRSKTGRLFSILVQPEAMSIINKYRGTNFLLEAADKNSDYHSYLSRMNKNLKLLGEVDILKHGKKIYTPVFPELSTYWSRHTWATIAAYLDIPKETISAALGHSERGVTDIYINFDMRKVDEANRKVIDYLNNL